MHQEEAASEKVGLYGQQLMVTKEDRKCKKKTKTRHLHCCANRMWFRFGTGSYRKQHLARKERRPICQKQANEFTKYLHC